VNQEIHVSLDHGSHGEVSPGELVPIVVPIASFGTTVVIVAIVLYFRLRATRLKHELVRIYLDKGQPVPPLVLGEGRSPNADLRRGLVLLATGVSIAIAFALGGQGQVVGLGVIPALIGVAYLVVWRIERARSDAEHG
jgi:hypothetical protein